MITQKNVYERMKQVSRAKIGFNIVTPDHVLNVHEYLIFNAIEEITEIYMTRHLGPYNVLETCDLLGLYHLIANERQLNSRKLTPVVNDPWVKSMQFISTCTHHLRKRRDDVDAKTFLVRFESLLGSFISHWAYLYEVDFYVLQSIMISISMVKMLSRMKLHNVMLYVAITGDQCMRENLVFLKKMLSSIHHVEIFDLVYKQSKGEKTW